MKKYKFQLFISVIILIITIFGLPNPNSDYDEFQDNYIPGFTSQEGCILNISEAVSIVNSLNNQSAFNIRYFFSLDSTYLSKCFFKIVGNDPAYYEITQNTDVIVTIGFPFLQGLTFQLILSLIFFMGIGGITKNTLHKNEIFKTIFLTFIFSLLIFKNNDYVDFVLKKHTITKINELYIFTVLLIFAFLIQYKFNYFNTLYLIPYSFLFYGFLYSSTINVWFFLIALIGVRNKISKYRKINLTFLFFSSIWLLNYKPYDYFDADKIRGMVINSSSIQYYFTVLVFVFFVLHGLIYIVETYKLRNLNKDKFLSAILNSSSLVVLIGILSALNPIMNILSQLLLLSVKSPSKTLELTQYGSWSGLYPSAESAGEIFFIVIAITFFLFSEIKKVNYLNILKVILIFCGLYVSDAKSSYILLSIFLLYLLAKNKKRYVRNLFYFLIIFLLLIIYFANTNLLSNIDSDNLNLKYYSENNFQINYLSSIEEANITSTHKALRYLPDETKRSLITLADLINRDTIWIYSISRYDPNPISILFGSGIGRTDNFFNIEIPEDDFTLPHSSVFTLYMYLGIFGLLLITFSIFFHTKRNKNNLNNPFFYLLILTTINWFKTDSIFYTSNVLYCFIIFILFIKSSFQNENL